MMFIKMMFLPEVEFYGESYNTFHVTVAHCTRIRFMQHDQHETKSPGSSRPPRSLALMNSHRTFILYQT